MNNLIAILSNTYVLTGIIVVIVVIIGLIDLTLEIKRHRQEIEDINEFTLNLNKVLQEVENKNHIDCPEAEYVLKTYSRIDKLVYGLLYSPFESFANDFMRGDWGQLEHTARRIVKLEIDGITKIENQIKEKKYSYINPFTLFYRGIGSILKYMFGYLIVLFNKDFNYEGKFWKSFVGVISLVSMIMTIACFFGLDFKAITTLF